jgi:hypothetical protein
MRVYVEGRSRSLADIPQLDLALVGCRQVLAGGALPTNLRRKQMFHENFKLTNFCTNYANNNIEITITNTDNNNKRPKMDIKTTTNSDNNY